MSKKILILIIVGVLVVAGGIYFYEYKKYSPYVPTDKTADWKNCNDYEVPMSKEEMKECTCPEEYKKFQGLSRVYCATDSQKHCSVQTDCPKGEHCISDDGKNWFCTGRYTGCYFNDPENPTVQFCGD